MLLFYRKALSLYKSWRLEYALLPPAATIARQQKAEQQRQRRPVISTTSPVRLEQPVRPVMYLVIPLRTGESGGQTGFVVSNKRHWSQRNDGVLTHNTVVS